MYAADLFENIFMQKIIRGWPQRDRDAACVSLKQRMEAGETRVNAERNAVAMVQAARHKRGEGACAGWQAKRRDPSEPSGTASPLATKLAIKVYNRYGKRID